MNNETERAAFEAAFPVPKYVKFSRAERYIGECSRDADLADDYNDKWKVWQARAALPTTGGEVVRDALTVIRDLDAISMALAARLTGMGSKITGGHEYLLRDAVMREVVEWRRQWDANSAARQDFAGLLRATHRPEPAQPDSGEGEA